MAFNPLLRSLVWLALGWTAVTATAQAPHSHDAELGRVSFPVSCSPVSQRGFNQAITLLHHMTYPQARQAFEKVIAADPGCAMAHWGVAMTLFQPLWPTRPSPADLSRGWQEVKEAKSLAPPTQRERLFIDAAEAFFLQPDSSDYWLRIRRWEEASKRAYTTLPADSEVALFYALAHLATTPAGGNLREHADKSAAIILEVYKRNPDHPGAMHYLIHANDVPGRERELLEITRKYDAIAPNNPHALHMPTHIYTRLGDWDGVIKGNLRAAEAALLYPAGEKGNLVWDEFAHAVEYLVYAYLQEGKDTAANRQLTRLRNTPRLEPSFKTAFHLASTQARYALERRQWAEAAAIVPRTPTYLDWDRFMWAEATACFARGMGAAHLGKLNDVPPTLKRLGELEAAARAAHEELFAQNIRLLNLELTAWSAQAKGDRERAVKVMREAVSLEGATPKHPVTPGPTLPAAELLGDLYLEHTNPSAALIAYRSSLQRYPRRFHSLLGAAQAASQSGDTRTARDFYNQFLEVAGGGSRKAQIDEARRYLVTSVAATARSQPPSSE